MGTYSYRNLDRPTTPLRLAGNWVPLPSTDGVSARTLQWETRKTVKHPDKGGESVKILVLAGSGGTTPTPPTCTAQTCSPQPCPSGQTGQINYTWSQSQCKCVESSRTCQVSSGLSWQASTLHTGCYGSWCYPGHMNCTSDGAGHISFGSGKCATISESIPSNIWLLIKNYTPCAAGVNAGDTCSTKGAQCYVMSYGMTGTTYNEQTVECCGNTLLLTCN